MSNAWYYYVFPLGISIVFAVAGVASLVYCWTGPRGPDGRRKFRPGGLAGGIFGLGLGGTVGIYFVLTSPTPGERERILDHAFRTPPDRIERFVIKGGNPAVQYRPLTTTDVVIDDPARVRRIADILRAATEEAPNHPRSRWTANLEMVTRDGTYYFSVNRTVPGHPNGTLVSPLQMGRGGWNLGNWRADGLDEVLEEAVNRAGESD